MTGWERLGIGGLSQGYLSGRLSPSAVLDDALAGIAAIADDLSAETHLAKRKSCIMRRRVATQNVRANVPRHTISGTCGFGA
jgi:hypothetical protein